jgi:hypothetical protein
MFCRRATTLFEVAISLMIVTSVIVIVLMLFPVGLKAQQFARYRLVAAVKMLQMGDMYAQPEHAYHRRSTEAELLGQSNFTTASADLERCLQSYYFNSQLGTWIGTLPLPDEIARRIDSDNDEISDILSAGGKLFYGNPRVPAGEWSDEAQKLVLAVVGHPQQDALRCHPCISWPYQDFYPSPPIKLADGRWPERDSWIANSAAYAWPGLDQMKVVCTSAVTRAPFDSPAVAAYLDACQKLLTAVGVITVSTAGGPVPKAPADWSALPKPWLPDDENVFPKAFRVLAIRYLAHAASLKTASSMPPPTPDEIAYAQDTHEACLQWAHRYVRSDPYDWGAPRLSQEISAMDFPLLQFDLFSPWSEQTDGSSDTDRSWKIISPSTVHNAGPARGHYGFNGPIPDNRAAIAGSWGDPGHFNLTARFAAAERCRQVVFWAVDWRSYDDFESAPSAQYDAKMHNFDSRGKMITSQDIDNNPERDLIWADDTHSALGYSISGDSFDQAGTMYLEPDRTVGNFGADRNGNGKFDRGPIPPSVRLRATQVGRFNYYDKRFVASLRY